MTPSAAPVGSPAAPARVSTSRVPELEDFLNRSIYHPLAYRLARLLQPTAITPNMVSVASGGLICVAAVLYTGVSWPVGALAGFACHLLWHVADGADGDLARLTGKASPIGEFVDGAADYLGHIVMYVMLAAMLQDGWVGGWAWPLAFLAGFSRIAQSNHAETRRRQYLWRVYGIPWLGSEREGGKRVFSERGWLSRSAAGVMRGYLALGQEMAPYSARVDALVEATRADDARGAALRQRIRDASHGSLRLQKWLGANPRTILLGLSMLAGTPLWYFLIEGVLLNGLLALSVTHSNAVERRLLAAS